MRVWSYALKQVSARFFGLSKPFCVTYPPPKYMKAQQSVSGAAL